MWINPDTGTVYSLHSDIRRAFPHVSFPAQINDADLAAVGLQPVADMPQPFNDGSKVITELPPILIDGVWQRQWQSEDAPASVLAERLNQQWAAIRQQRNEKLSATDWTQLPDAPVDQATWALYRQALRDVPQQDDPFAIVWPAQPQM